MVLWHTSNYVAWYKNVVSSGPLYTPAYPPQFLLNPNKSQRSIITVIPSYPQCPVRSPSLMNKSCELLISQWLPSRKTMTSMFSKATMKETIIFRMENHGVFHGFPPLLVYPRLKPPPQPQHGPRELGKSVEQYRQWWRQSQRFTGVPWGLRSWKWRNGISKYDKKSQKISKPGHKYIVRFTWILMFYIYIT